MINILKFVQSVRNEIFKVSWPTAKETYTSAIMVVLMAIVAAVFFLILDQIYTYILKIILNY